MSTTRRRGREYLYYICYQRRTGSCPALRIRAGELEEMAAAAFLRAAGAAEIRRRVLIPAQDHGAELAKVEEAIANLEKQYVDGRLYQGESGAARFAAMMTRLGDKRDALAGRPSAPARIEYEPTGETVAGRWAELDGDHGARRMLMSESGFALRAFKDRHELDLWFQLDRDLAARAAAAAEGHAGDVPPPDREHWLGRKVLRWEDSSAVAGAIGEATGWRVTMSEASKHGTTEAERQEDPAAWWLENERGEGA
jgi:hypothetical protein